MTKNQIDKLKNLYDKEYRNCLSIRAKYNRIKKHPKSISEIDLFERERSRAIYRVEFLKEIMKMFRIKIPPDSSFWPME